MPKFEVTVEKTMTCSGIIEVEAVDSDAALKQISDRINSGKLQTTEVNWDDPEYNDGSFQTTGDVN